MSEYKKIIQEYAVNTRHIILSTSFNNRPNTRTLASFGADGNNIYFATGKGTNKVKEIEANNLIAILFQNENQELKDFANITVYGIAEEISEDNDLKEAVESISKKSVKFKGKASNGELDFYKIYKVIPEEIKIIDFSKGAGTPSAVKFIKVTGAKNE